MMTDLELLELHREIVAIPSVSGEEELIRRHLAHRLSGWGLEVLELGDNLVAMAGQGPVLCLCSHLDTVPPAVGWTRAPFETAVEDGRVYGLGSNDAKASVAAMIAATLRWSQRGSSAGFRVVLALTAQEEVGGAGAEFLVPELARRGLQPKAVIVGEPTQLDIAIAQKGLLVLELHTRGIACHAANARTLAAPNAIVELSRDLLRIVEVDFGAPHPVLGPVTVEPTVVLGGSARNMVPSRASCVLDARVNPQPDGEDILRRLRAAIGGELEVKSSRLKPCEIAPDHPLVRTAQRARPSARLYGSRGLSDLVFFGGIPGIKVGPGHTERSHTCDEFVLESEILEGARFYEAAIAAGGDWVGGCT